MYLLTILYPCSLMAETIKLQGHVTAREYAAKIKAHHLSDNTGAEVTLRRI